MKTSFIKKTGAIALAMVFFFLFAPFSAGALTPIEVDKLVASDGASGDSFGYSVAVDGDTAVIGAVHDDDNGLDSGAAYVFSRIDGIWRQQAKLTASDGAAYDYFGVSVAVDGDTAVIGAYYDDDNGYNSGAVYVFIRSGDSWVRQAKLTASDGAGWDYFGVSVAVDGDTAVIGAHYDDDNGTDSGSAYVFGRSDGAWAQQTKLTAPDWAAGSYFGYSVAVDGDTAVIGAYGDYDNGTNSGAAYVFGRSDGAWAQQTRLTAADGVEFHYFGRSVAVNGDTAIIGALGDSDNGSKSGAAYVFSRSGSTWVQQAKLTASDGAANDWFGVSVAVDGDTAVIGALYDDDNGSDSGSAYVFSRSGGTWAQQAKLTAFDGTSGDHFGASVAVDGDTAAVIGALYDDDNGSDSGSAYVFSLAPPDNDEDGVPDAQDNCPDTPNPDQADSDYDTLGDACDVTFDTEAVIDVLEFECGSSVELLTAADPPGVKGMINTLIGNGGVVAKVTKAKDAYLSGKIDYYTYLDRLNRALDQLDAYNARLEDKIDRGKIADPDALELEQKSADMRTGLIDVINHVMP